MKFKDWFSELNPDLIVAYPFKCIGWCEKFFFYVDEECPLEELNIWHDVSIGVECFVDVNSSDDHVNFIRNLCKEKIKNFIDQEIQYWEQLSKALN